MKLQTIETPVSFKPITLAITFESVEELREMFNRMNKNTPPESSTYGNVKNTGMSDTIWNWVDSILRNLEDRP